MKNVWLKTETEELLDKARLKWVEDNQDSKVTDDLAIRKALGVYIDEQSKQHSRDADRPEDAKQPADTGRAS